jgi:two-component system, OmpR family, phosphate regulon sensor histidine kinase PhoR
MLATLLIVTAALVVALLSLLTMIVKRDAWQHAHVDAERDLAVRLAAKENERAALRAILDGIGEGLLALDRRRRVVLANRRFLEMFAIAGEVAGRSVGEVIRVASVFNAFDAALDGKESTERFALGMSDRRIEVRAIPMNSEQIAAVALFIDVTQLESLEQIRRDFISDFTHEVRTPLAGLMSAVESFGAASLTADEEQQLRRIMARQLKRLQRLVDDLAELSRIESGDLTLDVRPFDLRRLLDDLCEDFTDRAAQKGLRFAIEGEHATVSADPIRIQQAFANLLDNAIKYGGENSAIDIAIAQDAGFAVVRVTDHGEGIAPEERERIFRRFYRIDKSRSQDVSGTGLGLAITKHLVLLHRGSIDVESEPGRGATFIVRLPLAQRHTTL